MREWLNVAAAIGALLVGVVSFWTTARISGLEDYLKSEIIRRNRELDQISDQASSLQKAADSKADRSASLQIYSDRIVSDYLKAQSRLAKSEQNLSEIRFKINTAMNDLQSQRRDQIEIQRVIGDQKERIEVAQKRATFQNMSLGVWYTIINLNRTGHFMTSEDFKSIISGIEPAIGGEELLPEMGYVRNNILKYCPFLQDIRAVSTRSDSAGIPFAVAL